MFIGTKPSQKLPRNVRAKRAFVRAVAVNHQTRRDFQASRIVSRMVFMVIPQGIL